MVVCLLFVQQCIVYRLLSNLGTPTINTTIAEAIDTLYEMRLETLLSVDDLVSAVVKTLEVSEH